MYTKDDLLSSEMAKIQPGLWGDINRVLAKYPTRTIRSLDLHDLAAADTWIQVDHKYYWIRDVNIPENWQAGTDWIDFIVKLAKGPWVKKVGVLREFPFTEAPIFPGVGAFVDWHEVLSPSELLRIASQGSGPGIAPNYTLTIKVTDNNGNPINGARVDIGDHTQTTNSLGEAYFTIPGGNYTVRVSQTGFQPQSSAITLDQNKTLRYALNPAQPATGGGNPPPSNKGTKPPDKTTQTSGGGGFLDQIASALHVSRQTAEWILIGGGGLLLFLFLKKKKGVI